MVSVTCLHTCSTTKNIITRLTVYYMTSFVDFLRLSLRIRTKLNQSVWWLMYWFDVRVTEARLLVEVNDFSLLRTVETSRGLTRLFVLRLPGAFLERIESPGHETDRKNLPSAVVKIAWSFSFVSPHTLMTYAYLSRGPCFNFHTYVKIASVSGARLLSRVPRDHSQTFANCSISRAPNFF